MLVTGFEYALLISIIIGVTNVIPYFGPFIGGIPSIFLLLVIDPKHGLIFAVFVFILQQLDGNVIGPLILGESLNLSSMWILLAILIGGGLFGVPGMILGAPTLACICAVLENDTGKRLSKKSLPTQSRDFLAVESVEATEDSVKLKYFEAPEGADKAKKQTSKKKAK
jgi:predicted PurR-regulated permease PerM